MAQVGYRRVSTRDQNPARQLIHVEVDEMFTDKYTGKTRDRPAFNNCIRYLRKGDTLHVHSLDRLARNLSDLQKIIEDLVAQGIGIEFHKEKLSITGDMDPISKLLMQLMGAVAEMELSLIRERQKEGIEAARAAGKKWGAPSKVTPELTRIIIEMLKAGLSKSAIAKQLHISRNTLYKALPREARTKTYPQSHIPPKEQAKSIWAKLSKVTIDKDRCIKEPFISFHAGTQLFDIYSWIEKVFKVSIAIDLIGESQSSS